MLVLTDFKSRCEITINLIIFGVMGEKYLGWGTNALFALEVGIILALWHKIPYI